MRPSAGLHQRVDLDERRVLGDEDAPELHDRGRDLVAHVLGEAALLRDLAGLRVVDALERVDRDPGQRLGLLDGELLDLHAALAGGHREVRAVGAVQQHREVVLLGDRGGRRDHHAVHGVALDVHAEDLRGDLLGLLDGRRQLDAAGLAAAAGLDLRLDDDLAAALRQQPLGRRAGLLRGLGDGAAQHGHAVLLEQVARLVLEEVHGSVLACLDRLRKRGRRGPDRRATAGLHRSRARYGSVTAAPRSR